MNRRPISIAAAVQLFMATRGAVEWTMVPSGGAMQPPRHFQHKARRRAARRSRSRGALLKRRHK